MNRKFIPEYNSADNRQELLTDCEKLVNFEITSEELKEEDASKIHSTTPNTLPPTKRTKKLKNSKLQADAKLEAYKTLAKEMFAQESEDSDSDHGQKGKNHLRASKNPSSHSTADSVGDEDKSLELQLAEQQRVTKKLQEKLRQQKAGELVHACLHILCVSSHVIIKCRPRGVCGI